ncbi:MAG: RDD family protein [Chloroflexi bacterium]|nr:MAG: RDD family protein [Chloroflexota bacterium]
MASPPPAPPLAPSEVYAGFWRRVAAYVIDSVLILIGFLVLDFLGNIFIGLGLLSSGQDLTTSDALGVAELVLLLLTLVLAWLYYAGMESAAWQGTVGKRIMRLVVTDNYGRRIGFGRATGRFFAKILSGLILFVGYLMVAFTERKQGLHDLMASTLVIRQQHLALLTTAPPPASPAPPQGSGRATLVGGATPGWLSSGEGGADAPPVGQPAAPWGHPPAIGPLGSRGQARSPAVGPVRSPGRTRNGRWPANGPH